MRSLVGKMTEQKRTRGRQTPARPIVRSVVALVMLVQSLATIVLTQAHFGRGDIGPGLIASSFEANCSAGPIGDGGVPKQERHDCTKCGILCSIRDCDTPFHFATPTAGAQFWEFRAVASMIRHIADDGQPVGWASSWSSRAPPSVRVS